MSSTSYSRNKYRCLLRPTHNVIVSDDNINEPNPIPKPHIYPYGYPYNYPGYGYPGYGYGYPDYVYGYPGIRPYPYVEKLPKPTPKPTPKPKNEKMSHCEYWSSSSSSSSDDECYEYHPDRYYRRHSTKDVSLSPQRVFDEQNQKPFPIPKPTPNPPIHRPPRPKPPPPIPASETNHEDYNEIKSKKQFVKPFAKLLAKLTTPIDRTDSNVLNEQKNEVSLGDSNLLEFKNEDSVSVDPSMCNMNETKIYLKV